MSRCSGCNHEDCVCCEYFNDFYSANEICEDDFDLFADFIEPYDDGDESEL